MPNRNVRAAKTHFAEALYLLVQAANAGNKINATVRNRGNGDDEGEEAYSDVRAEKLGENLPDIGCESGDGGV